MQAAYSLKKQPGASLCGRGFHFIAVKKYRQILKTRCSATGF